MEEELAFTEEPEEEFIEVVFEEEAVEEINDGKQKKEFINQAILTLNERERKIIELRKLREKSITLDATLNQKRILEERNKLIETEKSFIEIAQKSENSLFLSKKELSNQRKKFDDQFKEMKNFLSSETQLKLFEELKRKMENILNCIIHNLVLKIKLII